MTAVVLALTVTGVAVFWGFAGLGLDLVDSIYFTVTITTTGFGDSNLGEAPPVLQLYGVALMLAGTAAHVVMCGLGNIGHRMVEELHELGRVLAWTEAGVHAGRHGRP
jgi:hypothetical protein